MMQVSQDAAAGPPDPPTGPVELPTPDQVDAGVAAFAMLAEPTRLRLLWLLSAGDHDVGTLAAAVSASPTAVSQHLTKLRLAGLVLVRRDGRRHIYSARGGHVRRVIIEALYHADHRVSGAPVHE